MVHHDRPCMEKQWLYCLGLWRGERCQGLCMERDGCTTTEQYVESGGYILRDAAWREMVEREERTAKGVVDAAWRVMVLLQQHLAWFWD